MKARWNLLLVAVVLLIAGGLSALLVSSSPKAEPRPKEIPAPLVRTMDVEPRLVEFVVQAQGEVLPRAEIDLAAEVAGQVVWVSDALFNGGTFDAGEALLRIDPRDYELAVQAASADVARAKTTVARERAEAAVALAEWKEIGDGPAPPLVARGPQLAEALAALDGAKASLASAELDLTRTKILAPFEGRSRLKSVDTGQFVSRGSVLARVYATDAVEVRLPVADSELAFLDIGLAKPKGDAPPVRVVVRGEFAGAMHRWSGRVVRVEGELDARTRMVGLVVRVEDPYAANDEGRPPLAVGMYVQAAVKGRTEQDIVVLPRVALRDGDTVLVVDAEDRIRIREVEVRRKESGRVLISSGLSAGERVCLSPLEIVVDGMPVRVLAPETDEAGS